VGEHRSDSQAGHAEKTSDAEDHSKRNDEPIPYIGQPIPGKIRHPCTQMVERHTNLSSASKASDLRVSMSAVKGDARRRRASPFGGV
jgi:hypothetical protein